MKPTLALIVPCLNEAQALPELFAQIEKHVPGARIYLFDNGSTDDSVRIAREHGAEVRHVAERGKGMVVARMFADVEADLYLMIDGDATYDLSCAVEHAALVEQNRVDMLVGNRLENYVSSASRTGHQLGNHVISSLLSILFGRAIVDVLSGYRMMSRRFVKSAPVLADGFEVEVMLTVHALEIRAHVVEVPITYLPRLEGSSSKLRTFRDGFRILRSMIVLYKELSPFPFFGSIAALLVTVSLLLGLPVVLEFFQTGLVPRFPTAILAASLMLIASISLTCGVLLDSVKRQRRELKRGMYLQQPAVGSATGP